MALVNDPYTFANGPGNTADASQVNARFAAINAQLNGNVDAENLAAAIREALFQPGDLKPTAVSNAPSGWLMCDASAVSRTTYSALFTAIGTSFGAGDGTSTFNLPDLRGRVPVGAGTGAGLSARTLGSKGGEENHTLGPGETPFGTLFDAGIGDPNLVHYAFATTSGAEIKVNHGSGTHNVMQPYQAVNWMIKT